MQPGNKSGLFYISQGQQEIARTTDNMVAYIVAAVVKGRKSGFLS